MIYVSNNCSTNSWSVEIMESSSPGSLAIIGSGPAAYTAAIYAGRAGFSPHLFEGFYSGPVGGQLTLTTHVENFPGFPEPIKGIDLMTLFRRQAEQFSTSFIAADVERVDLSQYPFALYTSSHLFHFRSLIIATGANAKRLDVPGTREGEFWQKGVTACATCDGAMPIFRDKIVYVIGGGDTAVEEALFLTRFARHVFLVHRRDKLRASKIASDRAASHPKITIVWNHVLVQVKGRELVESLILRNLMSGEETEREASGLFFAIGHEPNSNFLKGQLSLNSEGYIITKKGSTATSVEGVFAAGDVQDPIYRQAVTAAGSGCMAALDAERWLALQE